MPKQNMPISIRLTEEMDPRFSAASTRVGIPKNALARHAIEAAVEAIEKHDGALVLPLQFTVKKVPTPNPHENE